MAKVKVGIVGIGWWSDVLAAVVQKSDELELRACVTRSPDKAAAFAAKFHCEAMASYDDMLALAVGHSYRRHGALRHLCHLVDAGELGRVSLAEGVFTNDNGLKLKAGLWRSDPVEIPGGCLMQIGIHQIDNLLYLMGPATDVTAYFNRLETEPDVEDVTAVLLRFGSGAIGYVAANYVSPRRFTLTLHGTRANAYFDMDNDGLRLQRTSEDKPSPADHEPQDHLFAAIRGDGGPEIDGRAAMVPLAIVLAAGRSSLEGRSVPLSELLPG